VSKAGISPGQRRASTSPRMELAPALAFEFSSTQIQRRDAAKRDSGSRLPASRGGPWTRALRVPRRHVGPPRQRGDTLDRSVVPKERYDCRSRRLALPHPSRLMRIRTIRAARRRAPGVSTSSTRCWKGLPTTTLMGSLREAERPCPTSRVPARDTFGAGHGEAEPPIATREFYGCSRRAARDLSADDDPCCARCRCSSSRHSQVDVVRGIPGVIPNVRE